MMTINNSISRFIFSAFIVLICVSGFSGCKKYDEGPSFSLLPARVRLANQWELQDSLSVTGKSNVMKLTVWGEIKFKTGNDWEENGKWEFQEDREILDLDGTYYKILRLTNKELWISLNFDPNYVLKFKSVSTI